MSMARQRVKVDKLTKAEIIQESFGQIHMFLEL